VSATGLESAAAGADRSQIVTPPARDLRFVVAAQPAVTVRFHAPPGTSLPTVIAVKDADAERGSSSAGRTPLAPDGSASWSATRGRRRLTWAVPGFAPIETVVDTTTSAAVDLGLRTLDRGVTVEGSVVDLRGLAVPDAEVTSPDFEFDALEADAEGRFRLEHEPREGRTLEVTARGFVSQWVTAKYEGDPASLRIVLERGGVVRGVVRRWASDRSAYEDGVTLAGSRVSSIQCYLTGRRTDRGDFGISEYEIEDKHHLRHLVYNAKINIHRDDGEPIFLGRRDEDLSGFPGRRLSAA
jgi:hypothetical protein